MAFQVEHRDGAIEKDPPLSSLPALLREVDVRPGDIEHCHVDLSHESGWCIAVMREDHYVIFEHRGSDVGGVRHMLDVPDEKIIDLWSRLARGDIAAIESEPWILGYA
jgi:hypothetical protein